MSTPFSSQHTSDSQERSWKGLTVPLEEGGRQQSPDGSLLGSPIKQRNPRPGSAHPSWILSIQLQGEGNCFCLTPHPEQVPGLVSSCTATVVPLRC